MQDAVIAAKRAAAHQAVDENIKVTAQTNFYSLDGVDASLEMVLPPSLQCEMVICFVDKPSGWYWQWINDHLCCGENWLVGGVANTCQDRCDVTNCLKYTL